MSTHAIYEYLERIANLIRTDIRKSGMAHGLQPVQLEALHYLSRCNRYSNNPVAVAEFLGLTKGTVSQTLNVLEQSGLIERWPDPRDKRLVHLGLTQAGEAVMERSIPPALLQTALEDVSPEFPDEAVAVLQALLRRLQQANGLKTFGTCKTCRHHAIGADGGRHCQLTGEALTELDAEKLCREHAVGG